MKFKVIDIEFDFVDDEGELPYDEQIAMIREVLEDPWTVDDEDDLVDEISDQTGFCVKHIDYFALL